jgi:acyl-CoA dehydrogenase
MGACSLGASKKIMQLCQAGIKKKMDSGRDKGKLQADQFALADMAIQIYAAQQMLYNTAKFRDEGKNVTIEASMVKVFCTEMASRIADRGLDIIGEDGTLSRNQIEILLRDVRLYRIYEGTSEIQRMIVSRKLIA